MDRLLSHDTCAIQSPAGRNKLTFRLLLRTGNSKVDDIYGPTTVSYTAGDMRSLPDDKGRPADQSTRLT